MAAIQRFFRAGQIIFRENDPSHSLFIIKKGSVSIRKMRGSAYVEIAKIYTNEVIGELTFFDRLPRSATAVAINDVELLELTFEGLDKIYAQVPPYLKTIMAAMADRLRKANEIIRRLQKTMVIDPNEIKAQKKAAELEHSLHYGGGANAHDAPAGATPPKKE